MTTLGQIKHASKFTGRIVAVMKFLVVTILFLMTYLNLFVCRMIQHIFLKTLRTIDRQKKFKNLSIKAPALKQQ